MNLLGGCKYKIYNLSYCKFCIYTHPVNSKFTIWQYYDHGLNAVKILEIACHTYCDKGHPLSRCHPPDPWHSHTVATCFNDLVLSCTHFCIFILEYEIDYDSLSFPFLLWTGSDIRSILLRLNEKNNKYLDRISLIYWPIK